MRAIFAAMGRSCAEHRRRRAFRREFCDTLFSRTACRNVTLPVLDSPGGTQLNTRLFRAPR